LSATKNDSTKSLVGGGPIAPSDIGRQNRRWSPLVEAVKLNRLEEQRYREW
jgi:hypothetical protein